MKTIPYLILFISLFFSPLAISSASDPDVINGAEGGNGWSSVGGDFYRGRDNIWFLGEKEINYCIDAQKNYPVSLNNLEELVKESLGNWISFFKKYNLDKRYLSLNGNRKFVPLIKEKLKPSLRYVYTGKCPKDFKLAGESIHFLFGTNPKLIESHKKMTGENTLGFAIRKKYNHENLRNGGVVWISSLLKEKVRIKHILLHEIGHTLGMKHDSVFVMNEDIAYALRDNETLDPEYFGKIEAPSWVYRLKSGDELILTDAMGVRSNHNCQENYIPNSSLPQFIRKALFLNFSDCHKISLTFRDLSTKNKKFELKFNTPNGTKLFLSGIFNPIENSLSDNFGPGVFTYWQRPNGTGGIWERGVLDNRPPAIPSKGSFSNDLMNIGGFISLNKGIKLDLYFPQTGKWWSLNSIHEKFRSKYPTPK